MWRSTCCYELREPRSAETEELDRERRDVHETSLDSHDVQPAEPRQPTLAEQVLLSDEDSELETWGILEDKTGRIIVDYLHRSRTEVKGSDAGTKKPRGPQPIEPSDAFTDNGGFHGSQAEAEGREVGVCRVVQAEVRDNELREAHTNSVEAANIQLVESAHASADIEVERTELKGKGDPDPSAPKPVDQDVVDEVTESLNDRYDEWKEWYDARASDTCPRKITIYSDEELGEHAKLNVPLQVKHTTTKPVISSSLASEPCERLGVVGLLSKFNELLGTSYSIETSGLRGVLEQCIECHYDFGTAFGRLRSSWAGSFELTVTFRPTGERILRSDFSDLMQFLADREQRDKEIRTNAVDRVNNVIREPDICPRRVWDLVSNRIVPVYVVDNLYLVGQYSRRIWPVSHSWMAEERRHNIDTPINGHEWLVPLPDDVNLDRIRIELLNFGAEYVWLDVLCLRQADSRKPENEELRKLEWELDVPTIGSIYRGNENIVTYLNGLGRPFEIGDTKSKRHWLNRAWTLQEGSMTTLIGGTARPLLLSRRISDLRMLDASQRQVMQFYGEFCMVLDAGTHKWSGSSMLIPALEAMLDREASYGIDKVAGLTYIVLQSGGSLPMYQQGENESAACENAWRVLVTKMDHRNSLQLAFFYPVPGDSGISWRPSWRQLAAREIPLAPLAHTAECMDFRTHGTVEADGSFTIRAPLLRNCTMQLLAEPVKGFCRRGMLTVNVSGSNEGQHSFTVEAHHQQQIPEDQDCVLVGWRGTWCNIGYQFWIVGIMTETGSIRKVTVLRMNSWNDRDRLEKLKLATETDVTFI
ncbi:hypothetical protein NM688_g3245 [Phlebia brevispora]|uniref:Uncharacterized protein n=1 Tax=Phlebia brevispora TaxID=194682 RepID=A0ACC1T6H8_9APHY|nr:hypothetical protein NM688_g3245 [Phlebia brevispora]